MSAEPPLRVQPAEPLARSAQTVRCARCGYGAVLKGTSPPCPMCRDTAWEPDVWRPLRHLHDFWNGGGGLPPSAAS
jgi:hypothetical protein